MKVIVRPPSAAFARALSEHAERERIDVEAGGAQHAAFVGALRAAGLDLIELPPEPDLGDACFPSDVLVAFTPAGEPQAGAALLVATRPGAPSRRAEVASVAVCARELAPRAAFVEIEEPGTLDGGDVIVYGDRVAIGVSARTNAAGAVQLADRVRDLGYHPFLCPVTDRLHLASGVTVLRPTRLVGTAAGFASLDEASHLAAPREEVERLVLDDDDAVAANVLALGGRCFIVAGYPRAVALLAAHGETAVGLDLSEFTRADGGPTCLVAIVP
jgi:dimethylargininase